MNIDILFPDQLYANLFNSIIDKKTNNEYSQLLTLFLDELTQVNQLYYVSDDDVFITISAILKINKHNRDIHINNYHTIIR
jgi:hypothetical protein